MDERREIALAEYKEVATQFRKLTDIRFLLLTYLPLGTAFAAAFVSKDKNLVMQPAISAFAFVVTLCIATYDKRNDQHYDELVSRAAELERELQIEHGSFSDRPKSWLKYDFVKVEHRWPIGLIYAAAASLWAYLFVAALSSSLWLKIIAPTVVIACFLGMRETEKDRADEQREAVKSLMDQLLGSREVTLQAEQEKLVKIIKDHSILDIDEDKAKRRIKYHWEEYKRKRDEPTLNELKWSNQERESRAASALLAAVIDLPARWIEDVWTGRR